MRLHGLGDGGCGAGRAWGLCDDRYCEMVRAVGTGGFVAVGWGWVCGSGGVGAVGWSGL